MENKSSRILILMPSLIGGGAERTLVNVLSYLDYSRFQVDLAVVSYNGVYKDRIHPEVNVIPLFFNDFLVRSLAFLQKKFGITYFFKKRVRKKLTANYDLSISYLDSNFTDLLFFVKRPGKVITWIHSSYKSNKNFSQYHLDEKYRNKLMRKRYPNLDGIVFVSDDSKNEFVEIYGEYPRMEVVYNFVNEDNLHRMKNKYEVDNEGFFTFLAMGSLFPVKGYDKLIGAARILKDKGYKFRVDILGSGFLEKDLLRLIKEQDLEDSVRLLGFEKNPYPYLKECDVYVMTSVSEALPVALCEAMLLHKPTLVTNCSGCREIVGLGKYGVMVDQAKEAIAEGMEKYLSDKRLVKHYGKLSKERAKAFEDRKILKDYERIFSM